MNNVIVDSEAIAFVDDKTAYASNYAWNGLYKINIQTEEATFISLFPDEKLFVRGLHSFALRVDNKVYFIPAAANSIAVLDTDNGSLSSIPLPQIKQTNKNYDSRYKFIYAAAYGRYIWIIPSLYSGMIRLDPESGEMTVIDDWVPDDGFFFRKTYAVLDETLYIASRDEGIVLIFDLDEGKGAIRKIGEEGYISSLYENGEFFFASTNGKGVKRWKLSDNSVIFYKNEVGGFSGEELFFSKIFRFGDRYYLVPNSANMMLEMDLNGKIVRSEKTVFDAPDWIWFMFETDGYLYFRVNRSGSLTRYKISKKTNEITPTGFRLTDKSDERAKQICSVIANKGKAMHESDFFSLTDFLKGV